MDTTDNKKSHEQQSTLENGTGGTTTGTTSGPQPTKEREAHNTVSDADRARARRLEVEHKNDPTADSNVPANTNTKNA